MPLKIAESDESARALTVAKHCEWAGVACLFALAILIPAFGNSNFDLTRFGVPRALEAVVGIGFFASWPVAGAGLLLRAGELRLLARARTPESVATMRRALVLRRGGLGSFASLLALRIASSLPGALLSLSPLPLALANLIALALVLGSLALGFSLMHRANEMISCASDSLKC